MGKSLDTKIRLAIIDDGINIDVLDKAAQISSYCVRNGNVYIDNGRYSNTHGSYCAAIINKYLDCSVDVVCLNIKDSISNGSVDDLVTALIWCEKNNIDIINLSCGTTDINDGHKLADILLSSTLLIVAAQNNMNLLTFPACLPSVIGVRCNHSLFNARYQYIYGDKNGVNIEAAGIHKIMMNGQSTITMPCNSFATALMTSLIINNMQAIPNKNKYYDVIMNEVKNENKDIK